jgi:hypothetical protein
MMSSFCFHSSCFPFLAFLVFSAVSCAPRREFVRFEDAGTFRPGPGQGDRQVGPPDGEYDSYELIDHGAPSQGIAPMYQGQQNDYQRSGHGAGYPQVVDTYDPYGNPQSVIIPNPW